jgi:hypothetical protein
MSSLQIPQRRASRSRGPVPVQLRLEHLESRTLLSVKVQLTAEGMNAQEACGGCYPPDPDIAAGPDYVVGTTNIAISFYNKNDGSRVFFQSLRTFFAPINPGATLSDPVVTYDDLSGRFYVGILDISFGSQRSFFDIAVSNTSNPLDGFTEMHKVETTQTLADGQKVWSDYPKLGFNADAVVVTVNMDLFSDPIGTNPDHGQVIVFDKSTLLDGDPNTLTLYRSDRPGPVYAPDPATMHGSKPGDPLYFVQEVTRFGGDSIDVIQMTDVLTDNPTYTDTIIPVNPYDKPPRAVNPDGSAETFESFFLNADWRDNRLVATHDIGVDGIVRARWYDFSTAGNEPSLNQQGDINHGPGIYTYFSAIAIAPNGDLGMTFEESSTTEYVSMYVTGQSAGDRLGKMQRPVATHPGTGAYRVTRAGDFAGISVDPNSDNLFWAENLYKNTDTRIVWQTGIALFHVTPHRRRLTRAEDWLPAALMGRSQSPILPYNAPAALGFAHPPNLAAIAAMLNDSEAPAFVLDTSLPHAEATSQPRLPDATLDDAFLQLLE